jgi:hypothetical protein
MAVVLVARRQQIIDCEDNLEGRDEEEQCAKELPATTALVRCTPEHTTCVEGIPPTQVFGERPARCARHDDASVRRNRSRAAAWASMGSH